MKGLTSAEDILTKAYGKRGTATRENFREETYAWYFGEILKERRRELRLTQQDLADMVGKKRPYISRIENGEDMKISSLATIASALNLSLGLYETS